MSNDTGSDRPDGITARAGDSVEDPPYFDPIRSNWLARPAPGGYCQDCGHAKSNHEASVDEEFAISHGGVGYGYCQDIVRRGESAVLCACRLVLGTSPSARGALWPLDRPAIATIPSPGVPLTNVRLISSEVTTTDPITGQADFETVEITYIPRRRLIDTKSLKAYWAWWRGRGASMERLSALVAEDVAAATDARFVEVIVRESPRGGIAIIATSTLGGGE